MTFSAGTDQLLQYFILTASILLIPVAVALMVVLFKLAFLIHSVSQLLSQAGGDIKSILKDFRTMASQVEGLSQKTTTSLYGIGQSLALTAPIVHKSASQVKAGASALLTGLGRTFSRS